ncbi:hypothetical protein [Enterococcus sp. DIV0660C]|uniref:hypothetical protein n=1 Tax=Enterococcus sp. DIV0660C TaxID=2230880 RepID=UPI001A8C8A03|nr:hypothetical protein [Enterococcus sp. DIV0660C]MBO0432661.1 hypothetical protein [Enterococcus sp. DIV0660C]
MNYYDITFHELSGKSVVKRNVPSDKEGFDVWKDACVKISDQELNILINDGTYVTLNRKFIVRIDTQEVSDPTEKVLSRKDEIIGVVNTLSNMGF